MQSTPEKKRVTWKSRLEEVHFSMSDGSSHENEEPGLSSVVRCNLSKECDDALDPSEQADARLESLQDHPTAVSQASAGVQPSITLKGPESMLQGDEQGVSGAPSQPAPQPQSTDSHVQAAQATGSGGGLSEEEKRAAMKRRYSMLQQNLKLPAEEERRLKRERLRGLVPVWSKNKAHAQPLDECTD